MLTAIRTGLQARDDVLSGSLELIEREREIIRSELGHVQELIELEERRVAAGFGQVPTAQVEPAAVSVTEANSEQAAMTPAEPEVESAPMTPAEPAFSPMTPAEPAFSPMTPAEPEFAPMAQIEAEPAPEFAPMAQIEAEAELEPEFTPMAEAESEPEPLAPAARYAEMLRRIEVLRHLPVS